MHRILIVPAEGELRRARTVAVHRVPGSIQTSPAVATCTCHLRNKATCCCTFIINVLPHALATSAKKRKRPQLFASAARDAVVARRVMALSKLSGDEQGIILGQLRNTLEPRLVMYFSSASSELRPLLTLAVRQQLRDDHEVAAALCLKMGMPSCKELREARSVEWENKGLSADDLATLSTLGSVLPALGRLILSEGSGSAGPDGVLRLVERLVAGALPAVTHLYLGFMHVGDAGASALAAALDRGALPRLESLALMNAAIGDAALVVLAPALRRRPELDTIYLFDNPLGDEGLAALVAPPPPAGTPPLPTGGLKKLRTLDLDETQVSDAGYAALAAALDAQRRAACARAPQAKRHPCQRRGDKRRASGAGKVESRRACSGGARGGCSVCGARAGASSQPTAARWGARDPLGR